MKLGESLETLNPRQREAVLHTSGPLLILAGPGSGKTRVVTARVEYLLAQAVPPGSIAALTFTNKAADEMRYRLRRLPEAAQVWISTFHRFCSMLLRRYAPLVGLNENFTILDADDSLGVLKSVMEGAPNVVGKCTPPQIARIISRAKNDLISPEQLARDSRQLARQVAAQIYPLYARRLLDSNAVDFDDLLMHVAVLLRENPELRALLDNHFRYLLVDEYQDTNRAQYDIVRGLSLDHPNLAVTGDPDQSIYSWRGANIGNILSFEKDYPECYVVRLEQNYRSTKAILRVADALIAHNRQRKAKGLYTDNPEGHPVAVVEYPTELAEASDIAQQIAQRLHREKASGSDFAIFYRTNALSRGLEHALRAEHVPYQVVHGVEFYRRREIKDLLAYLHLVYNPRNDVAFLRAINAPPRGVGRVTLNRLRDLAAERGLCLLQAAADPSVLSQLTAKAASSLRKFAALVAELSHAEGPPISTLVQTVLEQSGYAEPLRESEFDEDQQRLANIEELISAARQFESRFPEAVLSEFLEQASLAGDTDGWDGTSQRVTLMTLHAAKGLEFRHVFVVAVEQNILPHERSLQEEAALEEERRLMFVGLTRAKEQLQVSFVQHREYRGGGRTAIPSRFIGEILEGDAKFSPSGRPGVAPYASRPVDSQPSAPATLRRPLSLGQRSVQLTTAAEMMRESAPHEASPKRESNDFAFHPGMLVSHPKYGVGKILKLSGSGKTQTGRIQFFHPPLEKSFRLSASPLRPVTDA